MTATADAVLAQARSHLGYTEGPNNDTIFGRRFGLNHNAWCDMFISCAAEDAGARDIVGYFSYTPAHAQWFRDRGQWGTSPRVGAIVFFQWPGMGRIAHVGIVEAVRPDGSIITIEGNTDVAGGRTGGKVMRKIRSTCIAGYGYPAYAAAAPKPRPKPAPKQVTNPYPIAAVKLGDTGASVQALSWALDRAHVRTRYDKALQDRLIAWKVSTFGPTANNPGMGPKVIAALKKITHTR